MIFLPGSCERCAAVQLVAAVDCIDRKALCGSCGGLVIVVAACPLPEGDVELFNELCSALEKSLITSLEAVQVALVLTEARATHGDREALDTAAFWLPALTPLRALLTNNPVRAHQALVLLDVILWERAKTRESGILPNKARRAGSY